MYVCMHIFLGLYLDLSCFMFCCIVFCCAAAMQLLCITIYTMFCFALVQFPYFVYFDAVLILLLSLVYIGQLIILQPGLACLSFAVISCACVLLCFETVSLLGLCCLEFLVGAVHTSWRGSAHVYECTRVYCSHL